MDPLVSVVIPIYGVEQYLDLCVQSVLAQRYTNLQIILVDDGSLDGCPKMCDHYAQSDCRVMVIHKRNGGLSDARNVGLEAAQGKYITFVDSDDILASDAVQEMVSLAQSENADIVKIMLERKTPTQERIPVLGGYQVMRGVDALDRIYTDTPQIISACGKLFRAELFRNIRFPVGMYYEDEFTTPKLYALARRVVCSESVLYFYMQWQNESIMRTALNEKKITDSLYVTEERIAFFGQNGWKRLERKAIADHYYKIRNLEAGARKVPGLEKVAEQLLHTKKEYVWKHPAVTTYIRCKQMLYTLKQQIVGK